MGLSAEGHNGRKGKDLYNAQMRQTPSERNLICDGRPCAQLSFSPRSRVTHCLSFGDRTHAATETDEGNACTM
jgi:hypothetical protein